MLLKAFEHLVGNRRAGGAPFGPGDGLHLGEGLTDGLACGGIPIAHGVDLMEQASDPLGPGPGPGEKFRVLDGGFQKVPADMGPAESQTKTVHLPGGGLVGTVAVDEKDPGPAGEVLQRNFGPPGRIQDVQGGVGGQDHPGPLAGAGGIEDIVPRFVRLGEGGRPAPQGDGVIKGLEERSDLLETRGDRPGREGQASLFPGCQKAGEGKMKSELEEQDLGPDREADHPLGNEPGRSGSGLDPLLPGAGTGFPVAAPVDNPTMGSDRDLQDLGGLGPKGSIGLVAGGADPLGLRKVDDTGLDRKIRVDGSPPARNPLLVALGSRIPRNLDLQSRGTLFRLLAVEVFLEPANLGLERFGFVPGLLEKLPVMPGLVFPVGGVLYRRGREIPRIRHVRAGPAGLRKERVVRVLQEEVAVSHNIGRSQSQRSHGSVIPRTKNCVQSSRVNGGRTGSAKAYVTAY